MDINAPPPDDDELANELAAVMAAAQSADLDTRRAAVEQLYEWSYKLGPKIAGAISVLSGCLADDDEEVGESATWALSHCAPASLEALARSLRHAAPVVRERAAHALGNAGEQARPVAAALRALIHDPVPAVRKRAMWALGLSRDTQAATLECLLGQARRGTSEDRAAALHALGNIGKALDDPAPLQRHEALVLSALEDSDADVRWSALYVLESLAWQPQPLADLMVRLFQHDPASRVREAVLQRLKALAPMVELSAVVPALARVVSQEGSPANWMACEVLAAMRPAPLAAVDALRAALARDELAVRAAAALWHITGRAEWVLPALERVFDVDAMEVCHLVCELGPAAAPLVPKLIEALAVEDWDHQWAASDALGAVASAAPSVMSHLLVALGHPSPIVRSSSALGLARVGQPAVAVLGRLVREHDARGPAAAYALSEMGQEASPALPDLRAGLSDSADGLADWCAIAIARIAGDTVMVPRLISIVQGDDPRAPRCSAAIALGTLGPSAFEAVNALESVLTDQDPRLQEAADDALRSIQSAVN